MARATTRTGNADVVVATASALAKDWTDLAGVLSVSGFNSPVIVAVSLRLS